MHRALLLVVAFMSAPVSAQTGDGPILNRMIEADTNRDGIITRAEMLAARTANFARFDRNRDTILTDADIPAFLRGSAIGQRFAELRTEFDANRDGKVTRAEFVAGPTPVFDRADVDRDNRLTRAEIDAAKTRAGR